MKKAKSLRNWITENINIAEETHVDDWTNESLEDCEEVNEAVKKKKVIRGGQKIIKKYTTKSGYKIEKGREVKMSQKEIRTRKKAIRKKIRRLKAKPKTSEQKRKTMKRRKKSLRIRARKGLK